MSVATLPALFYAAIERWNKPAQLRVKRDGVWTDISSAEPGSHPVIHAAPLNRRPGQSVSGADDA